MAEVLPMMRAAVLTSLLLAAGAAAADPPPSAVAPDDPAVDRLNRAVLDRDQAVRSADARAQADYQQRLEQYRAELARVAQAKVAADAAAAAYATDKAKYEAAMRTWQAESAAPSRFVGRPAASKRAVRMTAADAGETAAGSGSRMICKKLPVTGSLTQTYRECKAKRDWEKERADLRAARTTTGGCANFGDNC